MRLLSIAVAGSDGAVVVTVSCLTSVPEPSMSSVTPVTLATDNLYSFTSKLNCSNITMLMVTVVAVREDTVIVGSLIPTHIEISAAYSQGPIYIGLSIYL